MNDTIYMCVCQYDRAVYVCMYVCKFIASNNTECTII